MSHIHLKTALGHIRRAPFQALSAFFVLTITFFVVTLLAIAIYSSSKILTYFETRPQIIAFLKDDATKEDIFNFQGKLKASPLVSKVTFVTKEDALDIYKKATADNPLLTELVSPSIFPASLEVSITDLSYASDVVKEIKASSLVDQVGFTGSLEGENSLDSVLTKLKNIAWYIRVGGGLAAGVLVGTSFLILVVIISMRMTTRRDEMEILDLIGATPQFIRNPIIIEALMYAIFGVLAGWLVGFLAIIYSTPSIVSYFGEIPILPRDTIKLLELFLEVLGGEMLAGLILAIAGSVLAVSRVKKRS